MFNFGSSAQLASAPNFSGVPVVDDIDKARERLMNPKRVKAVAHKVEVFDLHDAGEREAYEKLNLALFKGLEAKTHVMVAAERKILPRKDGSSGWFAYLEWTEYTVEVIKPNLKTDEGTPSESEDE